MKLLKLFLSPLLVLTILLPQATVVVCAPPVVKKSKKKKKSITNNKKKKQSAIPQPLQKTAQDQAAARAASSALTKRPGLARTVIKKKKSKKKASKKTRIAPRRTGRSNRLSCISPWLKKALKENHVHLPSYPVIDRFCLFEDIMGMSEQEFQSKVGSVGKKPNPGRVLAWYNKHKEELAQKTHGRSNLIMEGEWKQESLGELKRIIKQKLLNIPEATLLQNPGKIIPIVFQCPTHQDPVQGLAWDKQCWDKESDIRFLQEDFARRFSNPFFVLASTFNALEGGMGDYRQTLSGMCYHPVQGEEAEIATAAAAIKRRYFMPSINLLANTKDVFKVGPARFKDPIIYAYARKKTGPVVPYVAQNSLDGFQIGLHKNIPVTSGYADNTTAPRPDGARFIPLYNKQLTGSEHISQIYTAAHNLKGTLPNGKEKARSSHHRTIAQDILYAAYFGSLLLAMEYDADPLVLPLLGVGAFRNDPDWIISTLTKLLPLIIASGMDIYIVVRHEFPKTQTEFLNELHKTIELIKRLLPIYERTPGKLREELGELLA